MKLKKIFFWSQKKFKNCFQFDFEFLNLQKKFENKLVTVLSFFRFVIKIKTKNEEMKFLDQFGINLRQFWTNFWTNFGQLLDQVKTRFRPVFEQFWTNL